MKREEAIKIVRNIYQTDAEKEALETLIPELSENEDERIRKDIIQFAKVRIAGGDIEAGPSKWEEWIAYLEKQKDASKAIEAVDRIDKYNDEHLANAHEMKDSNPDKKYYRGWDDALDAMAGILIDVYSEKENKFAPRVLPCSAAWFEDGDEKQEEQEPAEWSYPYGRNETADRLVSLAECLEMDGDCLFNEYSGTECGKFLRELARKQIECKPTWSEEDEEMINTLVSYVEDPSCWNLKCPREKLVAFIKSLPKRFSPHPKQEWSEEDEKSFNNALSGLKYAYEDLINHKSFDSAEDVKNAFDWLKFLRP